MLRPRRTSSILISPNAFPSLPTVQEATTAAAAASLNLDIIQGDILIGMTKIVERFFFFSITNATAFKSILRNDIVPLITSTTQLLSVSTQPTTALNIAFSQVGLQALGITDDIGDPLFTNGQEKDASGLGDPGTVNWVPSFLNKGIHGVFLLASDTSSNIDNELNSLLSSLGTSIEEIYTLDGAARPGTEQGHEHFGFLDGISQPAVNGFTTTPHPGQEVVEPGVILLGESNDPNITVRPSWAIDGSFLAFRQLEQKVPEFNQFLVDNPIQEGNLTAEQGSALLGARMFGRWQSGAPVDLSPLFDDPELAADPNRNNNFNYTHAGFDFTSDQTHCPFSAHIRKTAPRADLSPINVKNHIIRSSIPYGPEVTPEEASSNTTTVERGLAFVAYQSALANGFHFLQQTWANNPKFINNKNISAPGFDPIIGANKGQPRNTAGLDPTDANKNTTFLIDFVVSRGGEYFFSPSISALAGTLSA
ncbi:hypothetical protein M422DRAFT_178598 [Sphaerobolus stellatus SS14]|uniref:Peroxidase n=1 Tax=Sphaerobolus stellatus (strain SS14) TaxID=990650 RepID=A0A0C9U2H4_SPHS4|nr:hypothetical protein M422DRAFT_178598 [Sphaerobolus stellatus SS14]